MAKLRITDLIKHMEFSYSFEVTPNISLDVIDNLNRNPVFFSITWHAKLYEFNSLDIAPLKLASVLKSKGKNVLLHLSCDMLRKEYLDDVLDYLEAKGICNLFVVLGENYDPGKSDFKKSKELIEYIRVRCGDYFCIGVPGFPDHSEGRISVLKEKVTSGADFIITQAFFDFDSYKNFVNKGRNQGIFIPILPGMFVFETNKELLGFTNLCKVKVSTDLLDYAKKNENNFGMEVTQKLVTDITGSGIRHIHFFTLNKFDRVSKLVSEMNSQSSAICC